MDIGSIFLILALLILIGLFISRPLLDRKAVVINTHNMQEDHELSGLLAERDRILTALQELDFDHELGKIPEADYPAQRAAMLQRGAKILRRIDEYYAQTLEGNWEARIEAAIAARRGTTARTRQQPVAQGDGAGRAQEFEGEAPALKVAVPPDDDLETRIAARRRDRQSKSAGFCPQCGRPVQEADRFCPNCGTSLG